MRFLWPSWRAGGCGHLRQSLRPCGVKACILVGKLFAEDLVSCSNFTATVSSDCWKIHLLCVALCRSLSCDLVTVCSAQSQLVLICPPCRDRSSSCSAGTVCGDGCADILVALSPARSTARVCVVLSLRTTHADHLARRFGYTLRRRAAGWPRMQHGMSTCDSPLLAHAWVASPRKVEFPFS